MDERTKIVLTPERLASYLSDEEGFRSLIQDTANTSGRGYDVYGPDETLLFTARPGEDPDVDALMRQMAAEVELEPVALTVTDDGVVTPISSDLEPGQRLCRGAPLHLSDMRCLKDGDKVWVTWVEGGDLEPLIDAPLEVRIGKDHIYIVLGGRFLFVPDVFDLDDDDHCVGDGYLRREEGAEPGDIELFHAARVRRVDIKAILADPAQRRDMMIHGIMALQAREGIETSYEQAAEAYDKAQSNG